ncbi:ATP-binding protein [Aquimarina sp. W85]|uniref:hybrid sensor histidine kinase/response regulator n=1 Tax=Aquimarina rhodophyticola TaxID=3342246 RepID=UPI003670176A
MPTWIKNILNKRQLDPPKSLLERNLGAFINYLVSTSTTIAPLPKSLKHKVRAFALLEAEDKLLNLPELYLSFEKFYTRTRIKPKEFIKSIRQYSVQNFPELTKDNYISLLFLSNKHQEFEFCRSFLLDILSKISTLLTKEEMSNFDHLYTELKNDPVDTTQNFISIRKQLLSASNEIFDSLKEFVGLNTSLNIYLQIYKKYFQLYHLSDNFTTILNVIPEEILSEDLIHFPSKQEMLRMLHQQLYSLESINDQLTKEIIAKKKIEEQLKESEHLKSTVLETAMDGIILLDSDAMVLTWNKMAEHILGIKKEETIGRSIYLFVPQKLRKELKNSFHNYKLKGYDQLINKRVETIVHRKNGVPVHVELTLIAIKTKNDYIFNAFFRDITQKKKVEAEIREAKMAAEKSASAKSMFLSNMSHEIRTPLNVILGLTKILQQSKFESPETDQKNLDGIHFSAENLLVLVNDILDFSKIEAGKLTIHKTNFNIHDLIHKISRGFKIKAEEKGLKLFLNIHSKVPKFIIGDQHRLSQILTNLLGNAIKFTEKGSVTIEVSCKDESDKSISLRFKVIDTGIGIRKDKLQNIFKSFYQAYNPDSTKIEGTGLGLTISKRLIELQKGNLKAKSALGEGSQFEFSIKYKKSELKALDTTSVTATNHLVDLNFNNMKILIVDDNKMNQFFMRQLFASWKIMTDIVDNGKLAIEKLNIQTYDLILMDMHMPVMDGPTTAQAIRKSPNSKFNKIPIIACTADVFPESEKRAIAAGMDFYLTKPISENALKEILYSLKPNEQNYSNKELSKKRAELTRLSTPSFQKHSNFSSLKYTFNNDVKTIHDIIEIFLKETPKDYIILKSSIRDRDYNLIKVYAHKIKSSFKLFGIEKESKYLQEIENLTEGSRNIEKIEKLQNLIDKTYPLILKEIKMYQSSLKPTLEEE